MTKKKKHEDRAARKGVRAEGDPLADARYRGRTREYLEHNDPEVGAEEARRALRGEEGDELRAAESEARSRRRSEER